ncbi:unnamed protein product, partial [Brenthis ino]
MEENSKKRSRKTKLVPRQYLDSDDENIAAMQQEIETELANLKRQSLLKKLSSSSSQCKKDQQFSVKVEIEEYDEELTDEEIFSSTNNDPVPVKDEEVISLVPTVVNPGNSEIVRDINIRIESVRSLQNVDKIEVTCYKITKIMIKKEFEIFSKTTVSYADKLLEIHMRNYFGQDISEVKLNKTEIKIQEAITKWGAWMTCYPLVRDTPLMYVCYICEMAWWYLHDLKEHIKYHDKFGIVLCTEGHNSYIVARNNRKMGDCNVPIESNCWRCGKDILYHRHNSFICDGCDKSFQTCLLLTMHEGYCEGNRKFYQRASKDRYLEFKCPVCPWKHWKEEELLRHQNGLHSVRSDLPVPLKPKKCGKCKKYIHNYNVHDCVTKPLKESCGFCFKKFQSKPNLLLHYWITPNNFKCRVCGKLLKKDCVEFKHLLEHTDNYKLLYMCLVCKDSLCFFDLHSAKNHTSKCHNNKEKTNEDYCPVVIPKSLLQIVEPMKVFVPVLEENDTTHEDQEVDTAFQGLFRYLNKNAEQNTPQNNETVNQKNKDLQNNIQITIINKNTVRKIMNSVESKEIPEIIKNIKKENIDDVNNSNETTLQAHNYNNSLHINKNNDGLHKTLNTYSRTKSKKNLQLTDVGDGIKEVVSTDVPKIKEEPMDIDEINGINEINDIGLIDNNKNNDNNINNEMNDDVILKSVLQHIDELPVNFEIKEEKDDMYEDDIILLNENVLNSTKSCKKLPRKRKNNNISKKKNMEKYMWIVHNPKSHYSCTKCNKTYISYKKYLNHFVKHDYEPLTCPKCMKQIKSELQLWRHVNYHIKSSFVRVHSIENDSSDRSVYQCRECHLVLSYSDFFQHWESHLDIKSVDVATELSVNMDGKPNLKEMINPTMPKVTIRKYETLKKNIPAKTSLQRFPEYSARANAPENASAQQSISYASIVFEPDVHQENSPWDNLTIQTDVAEVSVGSTLSLPIKTKTSTALRKAVDNASNQEIFALLKTRKTKTAAECSREYRARKKALKNAANQVSSALPKKAKTSAARSCEYRGRKKALKNAANPECSAKPLNTLPRKRKTAAECCREYRARKKALKNAAKLDSIISPSFEQDAVQNTSEIKIEVLPKNIICIMPKTSDVQL